MSPMYKMNTQHGASWSKIPSQNTKRIHTMAWLNSDDGKLFMKEYWKSLGSQSESQQSEPPPAESSCGVQSPKTPLSPAGSNSVSSPPDAPHQSHEYHQHKHHHHTLKRRRDSEQLDLGGPKRQPRKSSSHQDEFHSPSTSPTALRKSRSFKKARLLDENSSLFPKPVKSTADSSTIAQILSKSLSERKKIEKDIPSCHS